MGQRTPRGFSLGSFFFRGSGVFSLFLSLPLLLLLPFSGGRPGCFSSSSARPAAGRAGLPLHGQAGAAHACCHFFSFSSFCPGRSPPPLFPPSSLSPFSSLFLSLSLSLSLQACTQSTWLIPPAVKRLSGKNKPGMPQRKRFTARLQWLINTAMIVSSASSHMDNCGESGANTGDIPDFWGMIIRMSQRFGAASALPFG